MPRYDYTCSRCGTFEAVHGMREKLERCPTCRRKVHREFNTQVSLHGFIDADWHNENGGRGRHISQLGMPGEEGTYARARHEIPDLAKRKGFTRIEKC